MAIGAFANAARVLGGAPPKRLFPVEGTPARDYLAGAPLQRRCGGTGLQSKPAAMCSTQARSCMRYQGLVSACTVPGDWSVRQQELAHQMLQPEDEVLVGSTCLCSPQGRWPAGGIGMASVPASLCCRRWSTAAAHALEKLLSGRFWHSYLCICMRCPLCADAERAAAFARDRLWDEGRGRLRRSFRTGPSDVDAFADDYAWLISG